MGSGITFVILSFEGPDRYSHAGGLGSRVSELATVLARMGFETHLIFVGDPELTGLEAREEGKLVLHRWCQWISRYHPNGVYDGEEGKLSDWEWSLPPWVEKELLEPSMTAGQSVVVMAEEWHTASAIITLHNIVIRRGWQGRVHLLWNANNTFSFDRINWEALKQAATITTVSRYMKRVMWRLGVDPWVIPNGIQEDWLLAQDHHNQIDLSPLFLNRLSLVKVARWDPDKRWDLAVRCLTKDHSPQQCRVSNHMSSPVITARPEMDILEAAHLMTGEKVKRLPVVADDRLVELVSFSDVAQAMDRPMHDLMVGMGAARRTA